MSDTIILVYYRFRGKLQPIRNLLAYLGQPFVQVHSGDQAQNRAIPEAVKQVLRGLRIDKAALPLMVFEGVQLYDLYPIMAYLARRFNREDLLGRDIRQKTRLQELLEAFMLRLPILIAQMLRLADVCAAKDEEEILKIKKASLEKMMKESGFLQELCVCLERQSNPYNFVLGTVTLIDFIFLQISHETLGLFHNLDQRRRCAIFRLREIFSCKPQEVPQEIKHLDTMRAYVQFMTGLPFYDQNKDYLQSFSMICPSFPPQRVNGLRKIWAYNKAFVK